MDSYSTRCVYMCMRVCVVFMHIYIVSMRMRCLHNDILPKMASMAHTGNYVLVMRI